MSESMKRMRGFTLIELMVSLTLGMIVLGAVVAVYVNSKRTFNVVSQRISMQQDARIALLQISRTCAWPAAMAAPRWMPTIRQLHRR
jgi:prepilin-type N-terminal cleavage/methylation domain-containing protein